MNVNLESLSKSYGGRDIFRELSLKIESGTRLAVVGPNGTGKSTLLKLIAGVAEPDSGRVILPKGTRLGYVAQDIPDEDLATPLVDWVLAVLPSWGGFWQRWEAAVAAEDQEALARLGTEQAEFEAVWGYNPEHRAHAVLSGLGFTEAAHANPLATFSGGWRERAKLARVLVAGADVLLLDEPTNHLDLEAVEWLESFLLDYPGVLIFVAHDRVFMDNISTHVLYLGGSRPMSRKGTFEAFLEWQEEVEEQKAKEAERLKGEIERKMAFVKRFQYKATKARQAGSRKKQAAKLAKELEGVRAEPKRKALAFAWPEPARGDKVVANAVDVSVAFGGKTLWPGLTFSLFRGQKIALAGVNGSGKSTLLKCLVGELAPTSGHVSLSTATRLGYFSQHQTEILQKDKSVLSEIRRLADPRTTEEELMSVLGLFLLGQGYHDRLVAALSGGEKSRLVLASLFLARANFLVLDEPTNHLDLESREALIEALANFPGTLFFVAHDRWLLSEAADEVWELTETGLCVHEDFESYDEARREAAACVPPPVKQTGTEADENSLTAPVKNLSREEQKKAKREAAEARNKLYKELKPLEERYGALEAELETALADLSAAEALLADPEVYADKAKSSELLASYQTLSAISENLMEEMDGLEAKLGALREQRASLGE